MRYFLIIFLFFPVTVFAGQGCCSHHGGQDYCDSSVGRWVCGDGTYSPSCECYQEPTSEPIAVTQPSAIRKLTGEESASVIQTIYADKVKAEEQVEKLTSENNALTGTVSQLRAEAVTLEQDKNTAEDTNFWLWFSLGVSGLFNWYQSTKRS